MSTRDLILKQMAQDLSEGLKMSPEMLSNILIHGWNIAKDKLYSDPEYRTQMRIEYLGQYICDDDLEEAYLNLMVSAAMSITTKARPNGTRMRPSSRRPLTRRSLAG